MSGALYLGGVMTGHRLVLTCSLNFPSLCRVTPSKTRLLCCWLESRLHCDFSLHSNFENTSEINPSLPEGPCDYLFITSRAKLLKASLISGTS